LRRHVKMWNGTVSIFEKIGGRMIVKKIALVLGCLCTISLLSMDAVQASSVTDFRVDENKLIQYVGTKSEVTIPSFITVIGAEAFLDSENLEKVMIHGEVTEIEYRAFANCDELIEVRIPDSVETIGASAFAECSALNVVYLGRNLQNIGAGAFAGCAQLEMMKIHKDNSSFYTKEGILYNRDMTKIVQALAGSKEKVFDMPNSVIQITEFAFWKCDNLETINLSNQLKEIPGNSFANCTGLLSVMVPYSVSSIGIKAFEGCEALEDIRIPESVREIHKTAFDGCYKVDIEAPAGSNGEAFAKDFYANNQTIKNHSTLSGNQLDGIRLPKEVEETEVRDTQKTDFSNEKSGSPKIKVMYDLSYFTGESLTKGNYFKIFLDFKEQTVFDTILD